ncbi:MAG: cytochrome C family protein [Candidatus Frackibacter sp. T328-2]|nr:MAG: cytochrome C family protein [Candidatus Frackibacter sp. T328-2]
MKGGILTMNFKQKLTVCFLLLGLIIALTIPVIAGNSQVKDTVHNLSSSSSAVTRDIKASSENRVCIFCHTPHNSNPAKPLWNHSLSGSTYTAYSSTTLDTTSTSMKSLTGTTTKLCLSCHDGTIAIGDLANMTVTVGDNSTGKLAADESLANNANANLGTDLSDDHPVLFKPEGDFEINTKADGVQLYDSGGYLQCTSCHQPHDNTYGNFLVKDNTNGALCTTCHTKNGWSSGNAHYDVGMTCQDCHTPHNAGEPVRLKAATEEALCYTCHDDTGSRYGEWTSVPDIGSVIDNASGGSVHPIEDANLANRHDALENNTDGKVSSSNKHSECSDCHDPHQVTASNPLNGVPGVDLAGNPVNSITNSYELCYKCHQGTNGLQDSTNSVKYVFDNRTYTHGNGKNVEQCNKCHGGNSADVTGEPVHGSNVPGLLTQPQFADVINPTTSDLCLKCHDSATAGPQPKIYFTNATGSQHNTKCTACHGDSVNYGSGINVGSETGVPHGSNVSPLLKNTQPALCLDSGCHSSTDQSNSVTTRYPSGYDIPNSGHPYNITNNGSNNPQDGSGYGSASKRPITNTSGCQSCHTEPSASSPAPHASNNHGILMVDINSQGVCIECHEPPSDNGVHREHAHESAGDCYYCHVKGPHDDTGYGDPYKLIKVDGTYLDSFNDATIGSTGSGTGWSSGYSKNDCSSSWSGSGNCGGEH